jgi:hypothetical protein
LPLAALLASGKEAMVRAGQKLRRLIAVWCALATLACGCAAIPEKLYEPQFHNPFPQLHRVAVLPFYNQSAEPTVDGEAVALAYYNELQAIPGFEVMPVGVARQMLAASGIEPRSASDFQQLARLMNVDAVLVGSVTEYSPYYPPRIGIAVDWYAANPGFHPIPAGYGLPWGTADEEFIPGSLVQQAEFELAREQLKTQSPPLPADEHRPEEIVPSADRRASKSVLVEICRRTGPIRGDSFRRRRRVTVLSCARSTTRSFRTFAFITATIPTSRSGWKGISIFARTLVLAVGKGSCSGPTTSSDSAAICT